jgi:tetratricopeptide (TPR) repeat protein
MATETGYAKASEYYKRAIEFDTAKAAALDYFWWGYYAYYAKNYDVAAKAFEQMETRFPDQPSASYWRARIAAAVDNEGKTGAAVPLFNKWLAIPNYDRKPNDLNIAYQYLAIVAYNKDDKAALKENIERIKSIDPNNALAKQLEDLMNKSKTPAKPAGSKAAPAKPGANSKTKK